MEAGEDAPEQCALRETEEELAIPRQEVEVLGRPDFICNQAGFLMQPVLGLVSAAGFAAVAPSPAEVGEAFTVPLAFFRETAPEQYVYALQPDVPGDFPYETVGIPAGLPLGPRPGGGPHLVLAGPRRLGYDRPPDPGHRPPPGIKSTGRAGAFAPALPVQNGGFMCPETPGHIR